MIIILDTETTGLVNPHAVSVGWLEVKLINGELVAYREYYNVFDPLKQIEPSASVINGFKDEDVQGLTPITDFALPKDVNHIIGHNLSYDLEVLHNTADDELNSILLNSRQFCTCQFAKMNKRYILSQNNKLTTLCQHYGIETKNAHNALADCYLVFELLKAWHKQGLLNTSFFI